MVLLLPTPVFQTSPKNSNRLQMSTPKKTSKNLHSGYWTVYISKTGGRSRCMKKVACLLFLSSVKTT